MAVTRITAAGRSRSAGTPATRLTPRARAVRSRRHGATLALILSVVASLTAHGVLAQPHNREVPLPDQQAFLKQARARLRSDRLAQNEYAYRETQTRYTYNASGHVTKTLVRVFEVSPALEPALSYRRLVLVNGATPSDLAERDREHAQDVGAWERKRLREGVSANESRARKRAEEERHERGIIDEVFALYDIRLSGRATIDGRPAILFSLDPRPNYNAKSREAKVLAHFKGRAWIDEEEYQLVRLRMAVVEDVTFGLGVVARLETGSRAHLERRTIDDGTWLPSLARFTGTGRILLLKRLAIDQVSEYSNYRKKTREP